MGKRSKILLVCGAAAIGVISVLIVIVVLIASGAISLTQDKIVFASQSAEFLYDGQAHTCQEWYIADGELDAGHTADVTVLGSQTEVGKSSNSIYVVIYDSSGADVTDYYDIEYQEGTLTVYAVSITVESDSAEKIYDGTPLSANSYSIYGGQLLDGHTEKVTFTNTITEAGTKENYFNINIYDKEGNDQTSCYDITCIYGELSVYYGMLVISTPSAEKVYDGTALTVSGWELISGSVASGHTLSVVSEQSMTNVGTTENTPYVTVTDASGANVTEFYKITYYAGTLTVTPYTVKIYTASAAKEYDGTALTSDGWGLYSANGVLSGHSMTVSVYGSQTDAGQSDNYADATVYDASGAVVTSNYDVQVLCGTLTVTAVKITVISGSATKAFDGKPLTCSDYAVTPEDSIVDGQSITVNVTGSRTYKGEAENTFTVVIYGTDASGNKVDVTGNYDITYQYGELIVTGETEVYATDLNTGVNELEAGNTYTFTAQADGIYYFYGEGSFTVDYSKSKAYTVTTGTTYQVELKAGESIEIGANCDMTLQIDGVYLLTEGNNTLYDGEKYYFDADASGTCYLTLIGSGSVEITYNDTVYGLAGGNTAAFELFADDRLYITADGDGTLVIGEDADAQTPGEEGDNAENGGAGLNTSGDISGGGPIDEANDVTVLNIYSETSGTLYLKLISFGDYRGSGWNQATAYGTLLDGVYGMDYLYAIALANGGYSASYFAIDSNTSDYLLPFYLVMDSQGNAIGYDIQTSDVYYTGSSQTYSGYTYYYSYLSYGTDGLQMPSAYTAAEQAYSAYVYANYLAIGSDSTAAYLQNIIEEQGFDKITDTYDLVAAVVNYVQNAATYNLEYDTSLNSEDDIVVAFLETYKEGICQHFASAATLLFRQLGIPARYTNGYLASTSAGEWSEVKSSSAHAWTEIYIDGLGWVNVDATGGSFGGTDIGTGGTGGMGELDGELSLGENELEEGGQYEFTADEDGVYSFTSDEEFTLTDSEGNSYTIDAGETFEIELEDGESVEISTDIDSTLEIDGSYPIFEGENQLEGDGDFYFEPDYDGMYSITGDIGFTVIDSDGNSYTIEAGETFETELKEGDSIEIKTDGSCTLEIDGTYTLYEGDNLLVDGGEYYFDAEVDGSFSFEYIGDGSFSFEYIGDGSVTITDSDGNVYEIADGEKLELDLTEGATLDVSADGAGKLVIGVDEATDMTGAGLDKSGDIAGGGSGEAEAYTAFKIYSDTTGTLYLKSLSYGNYNGSGWDQATEYSTLLDNTYSMDYLYGTALAESGYGLTYFEVENYTVDYLLPYYLAMNSAGYTANYDIQTSDIYYTGSSFSYSGYIYYFDYLNNYSGGMQLPSAYTAAERAYSSYVYENYLDVGADSTVTYLQGLIEEQGFGKITDTYSLVAAVVNYIQNAATYNLEYDTSLNDEEDIVVAFLETYKEGICQHFASAATLLFRQLGIPARYVQGYLATTTAGEWTEVLSSYAHAWTEIYIDGLGWVCVDATGGNTGAGDGTVSGGGSGTVENVGDIEIKPLNEYYLYDNTEHSYSGTMLQGLADLTARGYTYKFTVSGSRKEMGISETTITSFTLYDENGNDVTDCYTITYHTGRLQVYAVQITVKTGSDKKTYNGTPLTCTDISFDEYKLISGHVAVYAATGEITEVGKIINSYTITVYDENGNDVTDWYYFVPDYGTLEVTACDIKVTAVSDEKPFDGTALTNFNYEVTGDLPDGFTVEVSVRGSQTFPGYSYNTVEKVTVYDASGNDVTGNFNITTVDGLLTVTI